MNRPLIYREGLSSYSGPLEFYWVRYNGLLMIAVLLLGVVFKLIYRRTGLDVHKSLGNILTALGFGVIFLDIIVEGIRYRDFGFTVFALLFAAVYLVLKGDRSRG